MRWDEAASKSGAILVNAVTPGSAADKAGVRPGDRFIQFAGHPIANPSQFRLSVLAAENPVAATLERSGAAAPLEITLQLTGNPAQTGNFVAQRRCRAGHRDRQPRDAGLGRRPGRRARR